MIEHTKKLVEDKFTMLGGYEHTAEVYYLALFCNAGYCNVVNAVFVSVSHKFRSLWCSIDQLEGFYFVYSF